MTGSSSFYKYVNGQETVTSKHDGSESSKYGYIVNDSNLAGLTINANDGSQRNVWQTVKGVYIVPENQPVTRFGFTSISGGTTGNFLDNVVFETLLGNVKIFPDQKNDPDNIKVTGYWALVDENEGASVEYEIYLANDPTTPVVNGDIDMSKLAQDPDPTSDWSALIPKDGLEPGKYIIKVNHSDYPEAKTSAPFTMNPDVIYDANGGSKTVDGETVTRVGDFDVTLGHDYTVQEEDDIGFSLTGYTQNGWYTLDAGGNKIPVGNTIPNIGNDVVLYAKWEPNNHTVTYHNLVKPEYYTEGELSLVAATTDLDETGYDSSYYYGDTVSLKDIGETGYTAFESPSCYNTEHTHKCIFVGWDTVSPADRLAAHQSPQIVYSKEASFLMPDDDVDLYAVWVAPDHITVLYHKVAAGAELINIDNSPNTIFEKENGSVVVVDGADYFTYEKHKFVAWHEDAPVLNAEGVYEYNIEGHVHDKYGDDPDAHEITKACDTNDDGLVNLYAEWQELWQITYHDHYFVDVTDQQYPHDVEYVDDNDGNYYENSAIALKAEAAADKLSKVNHILVGWAKTPEEADEANNKIADGTLTVGSSALNAYIAYKHGDSIVLDTDMNLYAIWQAAYHLAYHANGGDAPKGIIPEVTGLVMGEEVTVHTNADTETHYYTRTGYTFAGWNTKEDGTGTSYAAGVSVPVNNTTLSAFDPTHAHVVRHVNLYAVWEPIQHGGGGTTIKKDNTLTYESNGGTKYPTETYPNGTVVDLNKVPAKEGYIFTGWYSDAALTNKITDVTMNGSKTVYAGWKAATVPGMLNDYDHFAYVIGYPDGMVQPNGQITRAEIATIFFRLLKPEVRDGNLTTENPFEDVKQGDWYNKPVSTMVKLGIVNGRTTTTFAPNAPITRAELATICARFDETVVDNGNLTFSDVANHWAYKEIGHAAALGWLMGYPDGTFLPDASITRAETMTLINRVLQRIPETESDLLPDMVKWPDNVSTQWYYLAVQEATNSHDFNHKGEIHETWTELTAVPDWTRYEN